MALDAYVDDGFFAPRKIADAFGATSQEVARTAGLGRDAVRRKARAPSKGGFWTIILRNP